VGAEGGGEVAALRGDVGNILCHVRKMHRFAMIVV
jgi:hypothetical protein